MAQGARHLAQDRVELRAVRPRSGIFAALKQQVDDPQHRYVVAAHHPALAVDGADPDPGPQLDPLIAVPARRAQDKAEMFAESKKGGEKIRASSLAELMKGEALPL